MASLPLLRLSLLPSAKPLKKPYYSPPSSTVQIPHSLISTAWITRPKLPPTKTISMSYNTVPATERLVSAISYLLPVFNGLPYGRFLFAKYPNLGLLFEPIFPLLSLYRSIPYANFVMFFALYLGVVRNPSFSRYVRFNAMQALVLDVLLAIPHLLHRIFTPEKGLGFKLMVMGYDAVFVFMVACFLYSLGFCVLGKTPYLPFVAGAADRQL
ncbi:protein TIC 20-II, chloroplastic-like [Tasmannia lanceolata]|uniref:protein TIC 20-II, chloroplastic-like n=1 Tax=Tasmannia lanceolata TaxID=3420 RepID=UPI0040630197